MKNLKLSYRLSIGFGLILLLLVVIAGIGVARLSQQNQTMQHITEEVYPKANASQSISYMVVDMSRMVRNIILRSDSEGLASNKKTLDQTKTMIADKLALLDKLAISDKDREMNQRVRAAVAAYLEFTDSVVTPGLLNKDQEAIEILYGPRYATQGALLKTLKELVEFQEADMHSSSQHANEMYETAAQIMGLAAFISLVIGALSAWLITRSVTAPLGLAVIAADRVAEGDLNHRIEVNSTDETGRLLAALRGMQASLIDVVGSVRTGTHTIATASSQIAVGNQDLSSRTEQQASSLEQTAASLEELTSTVKLNEENARQANHLAVSASEIAAKGGVVVGKVVETMSTIESSSKKIMDIISVIDSIAFQTNILALNAAVEAARAGEQGRGFAVVASEVRNLAQRSGAAAKEIKGLIDASVINVSAGSALVGEAGRTMGDIVASITRVTNIMGEITTASREQTTGIEQINQAITQMDQVTQQNAALVEEAAAAAGSLQEQAQGLVKTVSIFKLDGK